MKHLKKFKVYTYIKESSEIDELLSNPENMWFVYINNKVIGAMEYLNDALIDIIVPLVCDTEEEEYELIDKIGNILDELGYEYDDVDESELNDKLDETLNEMGKLSMYRIHKRNNIDK